MGYAVNTSNTTFNLRRKTVEDIFGFIHTLERGYMKFSITSPPFTLAEIDSVSLQIYIQGINTTTDIRLRSSTTGWGTTLEASSGDWDSTDEETEDTQSIGSTGYQTFTVDKNNLNLNGNTFFRLSVNEAGAQVLVQVRSQNHDADSDRPKLIIDYTTASGIHMRTLVGVGT